MALVIKDRVKETTTTTGTGTYTLAGAVSGFETFTANLSNSDTTYYVCTDNTDFEVGLGTFTSSGTTLARTTVLASSNSNNAVNWSSGTRSVFMTYPADKAVFEDASNNINGTFVGNITGNVTGNTSGTAATVTGAAQTNITSVGTLSSLTTSGDITVGDDLTVNGGLIDLKTNSGSVAQLKFYCESGNAHAQTLQAQPHSASASDVLTLPTGGNSTLVSRISTDTLTNKTLTSPKINEDVAVTSTATELNLLDGVTSTTAELNILDGVTSTATELNILDGVTSTTAELNILDGVTASAADINLIDGITNGTVIASKAIITDSNKDITGGRNITISGELDAATLDISGDADIDGTLEADAITVGGTALNTVIAGVTVTNATTAAVATTVTISDNESTNEENAVIFTAGGDVDGGNIGLESDGDLTYNPSTGTVTATIFKGNIDAVDGDFDGTLEADAITVGGTALATVIAGTTVTDATNSAHVLVTDNESTNEENLITFVEGATSSTGNVGLEMDGNLTYNPSTGRLTATQLAGTLQTAAQANITSLGTLTTLTVDNVIINGSTIGHTGDTDLMTVASGVLTVAGEVDATSLDISGNADIDGTLEADAITVNGTALNTVIADEATALAIALG
jgi:cytoskeletal protein CcmA (bactofilin family)